MRYLLLTDENDVDGAGSAIIGKILFGDKLDVEFSYYDKLDTRVMDLIRTDEMSKYDRIFITDLAVKEPTARYVEEYGKDKFILLDHHIAKEGLNKFNWCTVADSIGTFKMSGTYLFAEFFREEIYRKESVTCKEDSILYYLANLIRVWDTWTWDKEYNGEGIGKEAYLINRLYKLQSRSVFVEYMIENVCNFILSRATDSPSYKALVSGKYEFPLELNEKKLSKRIWSMNKAIIRKKNWFSEDDVKFGYIFNTEDSSEVGHELLKKNPGLDVICMINMAYNSVSLRTRREDIDLTEYTVPLGGGGHKQAAGCILTKGTMLDLLTDIWEECNDKGSDSVIADKTIYRHFKGHYYYVEGFSKYQDDVLIVHYRSLYGSNKDLPYSQPFDRFVEDVDPNREDNVTKQTKRFVECYVDKEGIHVCQE